jgi:hypothetical protein
MVHQLAGDDGTGNMRNGHAAHRWQADRQPIFDTQLIAKYQRRWSRLYVVR